jgi:hypothetical protein
VPDKILVGAVLKRGHALARSIQLHSHLRLGHGPLYEGNYKGKPIIEHYHSSISISSNYESRRISQCYTRKIIGAIGLLLTTSSTALM